MAIRNVTSLVLAMITSLINIDSISLHSKSKHERISFHQKSFKNDKLKEAYDMYLYLQAGNPTKEVKEVIFGSITNKFFCLCLKNFNMVKKDVYSSEHV